MEIDEADLLRAAHTMLMTSLVRVLVKRRPELKQDLLDDIQWFREQHLDDGSPVEPVCIKALELVLTWTPELGM